MCSTDSRCQKNLGMNCTYIDLSLLLPTHIYYILKTIYAYVAKSTKNKSAFSLLRSQPLLLALPSMPAEIWHLVSINNFSPGALLQTSTTQQSFACPVKSIIILASNGKNLSSLCINYADSTTRYSTHDDDGDAQWGQY